MTEHRHKQCATCAFRPESLEMKNPERREMLLMGCLTKVFFCHETMLQKNPEQSKWAGDFDPKKKKDGSPAKISDHQICAGFVKIYGDEVGRDPSTVEAVILSTKERLCLE